MINEQPNLKYIPAAQPRGTIYVGAQDTLSITGWPEIVLWENRGKAEIVGTHLPRIKNKSIKDGLEILAQHVKLAENNGYQVSYNLPIQLSKDERNVYRTLNADEMNKLRTNMGISPLKFAA